MVAIASHWPSRDLALQQTTKLILAKVQSVQDNLHQNLMASSSSLPVVFKHHIVSFLNLRSIDELNEMKTCDCSRTCINTIRFHVMLGEYTEMSFKFIVMFNGLDHG